MELFVYSDESGVFDKAHNEIFVFGGVLFLSKQDKDIAARKYKHVEKIVRKNEHKDNFYELKATTVNFKDRNKIYRSLNKLEKFGVVVHQQRILEKIFENKKSKQRYLDYAYKICLKRKLQYLIKNNNIDPQEVTGIHVFADEHTTATNGRYELQEALEQEFKHGTYNWDYSKFFEPLFPNLENVEVSYCNSEKITLIRAADITANKLYRSILKNKESELSKHNNFHIIHLP
ncbi:DUF3800 domain-containing protein [Lactobacillus gigeriorum]|uniref:DUF3800 domain-containing protein n=1 Tax=Lactobacillus gigeriorum DSM 23908 = CRBIP 24.85 TaxID=1423751 RepID=I7K0N1_9LACO|nr:DUF3800 domain-containing protein [Lactobacillus gigeriorum]KRN12026.1 hypothetical protein FC38_GL000433 [Lactobacillus gigeriorum DSM 23908 = CRBIP 24.85]CCI86955.1 Putative uncharacterized protein [Lactobacillus gigeriorum DSM 23908 = CRBIP 24.85]